MAIFSQLVVANLANEEYLNRMIPKIEVGAHIDVANLWTTCSQYQLTPQQEAGAQRIREACQRVNLEIVKRAAAKYHIRYYDGNVQLEYQKGIDPTEDLRERFNVWNRRDWFAVMSNSRVYIGQCVICGAQDMFRLPVFQEYVATGTQLNSLYVLHDPCKNKAVCGHCEEKVNHETDADRWAQWAEHRLCVICHVNSRELVNQQIVKWSALRDRRKRWVA